MSTTLTKLEILNETISYYSEDIKRRAVKYNGTNSKTCMYNTEDNNHCAVGRCFTTHMKNKGTNFELNDSSADDLDEKYGLDTLLEEQYKGHDIMFWVKLQNLHDTDENWDNNGLTEQGKEAVYRFKKYFNI